ncbi:hypothetical protein [Acetivibrio cellulolyticus]|uniref:hypothetical protein n=1 Tax=Acetivibrio cellulolyticus TaxID=35830 RepID=UPI0001E2E6EF|nr:hypothetical protein [Acetivibrio cellulolyticus]
MENSNYKNSLEELFFFKENARIREKYREMQAMKETKESLKQVSGIQDEMILDKFIALNIRPETLASLALIPLIEVAWADNVVSTNEKTMILNTVAKFGWTDESVDYALLEEWLSRKPIDSLFDVWQHYIKSLCIKMNEEEIKHFKTEILLHVNLVAEAEGGFFGINSISKEEKEVLNKIESSFCR